MLKIIGIIILVVALVLQIKAKDNAAKLKVVITLLWIYAFIQTCGSVING